MAKPSPPKRPARDARSRMLRRFRAWIILVITGLALGYTVILAKVITAGAGHPIGIAMWTSTLSAVVLVLLSMISRRLILLRRDVLWLCVVCGLLGVVFPAVSFYFAARHLPAGILSIAVTIGPILTYFFSVLLRIEPFAYLRILGVLFGAMAVTLLVAPQTGLPDPSAGVWVLLACVPGLCYALENIVLALRMPEDISPFTIACGNFLVASVTLTGVVMTTGTFLPLAWPWGSVEWAIVSMSVINAIGLGLIIYLITYAGPVFSSQMAYLITISGVAWGIAMFDERHSVWVWLSLLCLLVGLTLIRPHKRAQAIK